MQKYILKMIIFSLMISSYFGSLNCSHVTEVEEKALSQEKEKSPQEKPIYEILAREHAEEEYAEFMINSKYGTFGLQPPNVDEEYKKTVKAYKELENKLRLIKQIPSASMWGGINYSMSLDEMKQTVKEIFDAMKKNGQIISKNDFEKIKNNYYVRKPHNDATRIWGNQYLKKQIDKSTFLKKMYDVPNYIIVMDNEHPIKVTLFFGNNKFPEVTELENATIYFEKIIGEPVATKSLDTREIGIQSGIGYDDFSDPGNILLDEKTGKKYVVDTEFKSFQIPLTPKAENLLKYAYRRFWYFNKDKLNILHITFEL